MKPFIFMIKDKNNNRQKKILQVHCKMKLHTLKTE